MGSIRLPGKSMMDVCGKPMLQRVLERVHRIAGVDITIVATTHLPEDTPIQDLCRSLSIACYRGSPDNVLDRYWNAAALYKLDTICRVTADCPLLDWEVATQVLDTYELGKWDYVSNVHPPTYPDGMDVEVFSWSVLNDIRFENNKPYEEEHVTPKIWQRPSPYTLQNVWADADYSSYRWTVDEAEDLEWVRGVYTQLGDNFGWRDVLALPNQRTLLRTIRL